MLKIIFFVFLGCAYETLSIGEFVSHIKKYHSQVQTLKCHICPQVCFKLDNLLKVRF